MNPPPLPATSPAAPLEPILPAVLLGLAITWCADFLLWPASPGLSLGVLAALLGLFQMAGQGTKRWSLSTWAALTLLLLAGAQTAVEMSFSNVLVLAVLLLWIMAEGYFKDHPARFIRLCEAFVALLAAPGRWVWLGRNLSMKRAGHAAALESGANRLGRLFRIAAPAMALGVIFSLIFCSGNAVFREGLSRAFHALFDWIWNLDLSPLRVIFWLTVATVALAFVRPRRGPVFGSRISAPRWNRRDPHIALWQSILTLAALNLLFCVVNTIDAIYLWFPVHLPAGFNYTAYVHQGVNSLIAAVILSAIVMAVIFQQQTEVSNRRVLKALAHLWTVQNVVLIAGVFLRLKLYVDASELTPRRVYVAFFLMLVFAGFVLLTIFVEQHRGVGWLIRKNLISTFILFYLVQFANVSAWVAQWNVDEWLRNTRRQLDLDYLVTLGPGAWPSLAAVAETDRSPEAAARASALLAGLAQDNRSVYLDGNWRSIQFRRDASIRFVMTAAAKTSAASR